MDQLPGTILLNILAKADAKDCGRAACVDRRWRQSADDDVLWREFCLRDFAVSSAVDHSGNQCSSYKEAYVSWQKAFGRYPTYLVARGKRCWDTIKDWLKLNFTELLNTLAPGVSFGEIESAEERLGFSLPASVRVLYQMCNGQKLPKDRPHMDKYLDNDSFLGLLGGYHVYDHFVNVRLLPLKEMVQWTKTILPRLYPGRDIKRVVIATSCNLIKFFFVDCDDGLVYVGTRQLEEDAEMMSCVPVLEPGAYPKDGMLRWLEYYGRCLQSGMFGVRDYQNGFRSISLFPLKEPLCTEAITHGLQVKCSAVFVPEMSRIEVVGEVDDDDNYDDNYMFAYSVRMRLLQENSIYCGKVMESAQLVGRHWVIRANDEITNEVRAEAVIGLYPYLQAGGDEFVYESRSGQKGKTGSMEGDFTFVPGRISKPDGGQFAAYVPRVPLQAESQMMPQLIKENCVIIWRL